jgi:hypothetical protein
VRFSTIRIDLAAPLDQLSYPTILDHSTGLCFVVSTKDNDHPKFPTPAGGWPASSRKVGTLWSMRLERALFAGLR